MSQKSEREKTSALNAVSNSLGRIAEAIETVAGVENKPAIVTGPTLAVAIAAKKSEGVTKAGITTAKSPIFFIEAMEAEERATLTFTVSMKSGKNTVTVHKTTGIKPGSIEQIDLGFPLPQGSEISLSSSKGSYTAQVSYLA